jgi:hypothetical protein
VVPRRQVEVCLGGCNLASSRLIQIRLEPVKTLHRLTTSAQFCKFMPYRSDFLITQLTVSRRTTAAGAQTRIVNYCVSNEETSHSTTSLAAEFRREVRGAVIGFGSGICN